MPWGLTRFHHSGQSHFVTFCCYHRRRLLTSDESCQIFESALERVRRRLRALCLRIRTHAGSCSPAAQRAATLHPGRWVEVAEARSIATFARPCRAFLANGTTISMFEVICSLCRSCVIFNAIRCNAAYANVRRTGVGAVFGTTQPESQHAYSSIRNGWRENGNEPREDSVPLSNCPTQAKTRLEWPPAQCVYRKVPVQALLGRGHPGKRLGPHGLLSASCASEHNPQLPVPIDFLEHTKPESEFRRTLARRLFRQLRPRNSQMILCPISLQR